MSRKGSVNMVSFLLITKNQIKATEYIANFCNQEHIYALDQTIFNPEGSLGIAEVRIIQQKLLLKPFKSVKKVFVIYQANLLTTDAQNAMLKTLEEPPLNTIIFLTAENSETLLPTILSRCSKIILDNNQIDASNDGRIMEQLEKLSQDGLGEKLYIAQTAGEKKETALDWLEQSIIILRNKLLSGEDYENLANIIYRFQETHRIIKTTNVNPRFALENLFLSI